MAVRGLWLRLGLRLRLWLRLWLRCTAVAAVAILRMGRSHRRWLWTACPWGIHEMRSGVGSVTKYMYAAGGGQSKQ